jgi:hypothetical protein
MGAMVRKPTLRSICSLVNPDEPVAEFEHIIPEPGVNNEALFRIPVVIPKRDNDKLCILRAVLDIIGDD